MQHRRDAGSTSRRGFLRLLAALGIGGHALRPHDVVAALGEPEGSVSPGGWPAMTYRTLGRTGFSASRLVFGCGAALSREPADELLELAFAAGINAFDVGTRRYYRDAERHLAPFVKRRRDEILLISKAPVYLDVEPHEQISLPQARSAAATWLGLLDGSLRDLEVERVDAYYVMAADNPSVVRSEEMYEAFVKARSAGKVGFFGLSSHRNAQKVLETAVESGWYDLAMIAVTPAGWYDYDNRGILRGTADLVGLAPLLARARDAGMGLIGMKAARHLTRRSWLGTSNRGAFERFYGAKLRGSGLSDFQRSYAYVLEQGLDAVNADMRNERHLEENVVAAATSRRYVSS